MTEFQPTIGLEIHAQLRCQTKIFCGCRAQAGDAPNEQICPVCAGLPGAMPALNSQAVSLAVRVALALGCSVQLQSRFDRKHYFYPDLPKGYQITQHAQPLATGGAFSIATESGPKAIALARLHLEEDAGKSHHDPRHTRIDLNRAGTPLVEIVSEPQLSSPREAVAFAKGLREVLIYLNACDGNMELGSFRVDANISLRPAGSLALGDKVELKNLNSFAFLRAALQFEIERQQRVLRRGDPIAHETRTWNEQGKTTSPMRHKETLADYRYCHEPDLPPLLLERDFVESQQKALPELPAAKRLRFRDDYQLSGEYIKALTSSRPLANYFESVAALAVDPGQAAAFICGHVLSLREQGASGFEPPMAPKRLGQLIELIEQREISQGAAKKIFDKMIGNHRAPAEIVEQLGLKMITDEKRLRELCREILEKHPEQRVQYLSGKKQIFGFFVGQAMSRSGGAADPAQLNRIMRTLLDDKN